MRGLFGIVLPLYAIVCLLYVPSLMGQENEAKKSDQLKPGWNNRLVSTLTFTQNQFDNWTQGGEDSWSWQLDINGQFIREKPRTTWRNVIRFSFGRTQVGQAASRKAADELRLESMFTYKLNLYVNPYLAMTALTQVAKGFEYLDGSKQEVSNFLDPAYFTQSAGFGYAHQEMLRFRLGIAVKHTLTRNHPVPYADDPNTPRIEKRKTELGAESTTDLTLELNKNLLLTSKLELFSTMNRLDEVDVTWDNLLAAKVTRLIAVTFNLKLFYDRDISPQRQLKQTLSVGLSYAFL